MLLGRRLIRSPDLGATLRHLPAAAAARPHAGPAARRWDSSQPQQPAPQKKQSSANTNFWKEFSRPIAKVLLTAIFAYQLTYYGWARLEQNEIRSVRQAEVDVLEAQVKELQTAQKSTTQP